MFAEIAEKKNESPASRLEGKEPGNKPFQKRLGFRDILITKDNTQNKKKRWLCWGYHAVDGRNPAAPGIYQTL